MATKRKDRRRDKAKLLDKIYLKLIHTYWDDTNKIRFAEYVDHNIAKLQEIYNERLVG